jgi:SagB-type dehydrogenase family enzyme
MNRNVWEELRLPPSKDHLVWDLFHENSKVSRFEQMPSDAVVAARMKLLHQSLQFDTYPAVDLPTNLAPLDVPLGQALLARTTARSISPTPISLAQVASLLHYCYGITRHNKDTDYPRPFRAAPSGGALYPLELFLHTRHVEELTPGVYHYNPVRNQLRFVLPGDRTPEISAAMVQPNIPHDTSLLVFLTAIFDRSIFKYNDRGYRFVLLEAGHVAQNINLTANALGFGCINLGGYYDREIDEILGIDGVTHSTIYMIGIGGRGEPGI